MEFNEMCRFIFKGRKEIDQAVNTILKTHGLEMKNPGGPPLLVKNNRVIWHRQRQEEA